MALIVEVLDARGGAVKTRIRLDRPSLNIGRGFDNDLILDDVYVDARHARIHVGDDGTVEVEDLGSINGLVAVDGSVRVPRLAAEPGTQVRIGRTVLRFRDPAEQVAPALREQPYAASRLGLMFANPWVRAALCIGAGALVTLYAWLGSYTRDSSSTAAAAVVGFVFIAAMWSGVWSIASRVALGRFNFTGHFTVVSAFTFPAALLITLGSWATFLFPDNPVAGPADTLLWIALTVGFIAMHLSLSSTMDRSRRTRAALATTVMLAVMTGLLSYIGSDMFTDVPEFNGVLKPVSENAVPTMDVAGFGDVVADLADQADELAVED